MKRLDLIRARIFNQLTFISILCSIIILVEEIIEQDTQGMLIIGSFLGFGIFLLLLHRKQLFSVAALIMNIAYPLAIFALSITYQGENYLPAIYLVFVFTSILFHRNLSIRLLLVGMNVGFFVFAEWFEANYGGLSERTVEASNNLYVFLAITLCISSMVSLFVSELLIYSDENRQLIDSLKTQNDKLADSNEELERFTFVASHDMKTPLRSIISFIGLLEKRLGKELLNDNQIYFDQIRQSAHSLHNLVTESLEYVRIDQSKNENNWVDLNQVITEIERDYQPQYPNAQIDTENLPTIFAPKSILHKLLSNLIENGLKYNQQSHPRIVIRHQVQPDGLWISVSDNGIGIEPEYQDKIFEMYQRLHPATRYQGSGIGLAQCKKIIQSLGGRISLSSQPEKGSIFHLHFPLNILQSQRAIS
ncbi:MAG: ATP-binding protein [Bacteroidota bacterium]